MTYSVENIKIDRLFTGDIISATVSGTHSVDLSTGNTHVLNLSGDTTLEYSNPKKSSYNFLVKAGTYSMTLGDSSNWLSTEEGDIVPNGNSIINSIYDGTDMWIGKAMNMPLGVPQTIANLDIWLDGNDKSTMTLTGTTIDTITDKSPRGETFTTDGTVTLASNVVGCNYGIRCDSGNLRSTALYPYHKPNAQMNMFMVVKYDDIAGEAFGMFSTAGGSTNNVGVLCYMDSRSTINNRIRYWVPRGDAGTEPLELQSGDDFVTRNQFIIVEFKHDLAASFATRGSLFYNKSSEFDTNTGDDTSTPSSADQSLDTIIGGLGSAFEFKGYISEVVSYDRVLTTTERDSLYAYFADKWDITI